MISLKSIAILYPLAIQRNVRWEKARKSDKKMDI